MIFHLEHLTSFFTVLLYLLASLSSFLQSTPGVVFSKQISACHITSPPQRTWKFNHRVKIKILWFDIALWSVRSDLSWLVSSQMCHSHTGLSRYKQSRTFLQKAYTPVLSVVWNNCASFHWVNVYYQSSHLNLTITSNSRFPWSDLFITCFYTICSHNLHDWFNFTLLCVTI